MVPSPKPATTDPIEDDEDNEDEFDDDDDQAEIEAGQELLDDLFDRWAG